MIYATEQQVVVTAGIVVIVALVALFTGIWWGHRRGLEQAAEEQQWEQEQAMARRVHPAFYQPPADWAREAADASRREPRTTLVADLPPRGCEVCGSTAVAYYDTQGHLWCHEHGYPETPLEPSAVLSPPEELSWTGEIARMTAEFQRDMDGLIGGTDEQLRDITR